MEFAIPIAALAGLYVISKQQREDSKGGSKEGFKALLPNTNVPDRIYDDNSDNYPLMPDIHNPLDATEALDHNNAYDGQTYTDKYFNVMDPRNKVMQEKHGQRPTGDYRPGQNMGEQKFTSLMGQNVDPDYFRHNNMVPYFGSKIKQRQFETNQFESLLDSYAGSGSQQIDKKAQSPLFQPEENLHFAHGMPNENDFFQSRVNPSMRMANVKPFEEEKVGPGLGLGYTSSGAAGFNSGMMDREAWMPKSVDDLRVASHPKSGGAGLYGHEGPADSFIKSMATSEQMGVQEKHRPERTFEVGPGRLLTTTGLEKGQTLRSTLVMERNTARHDTSTEYVGAAHLQTSGNETMDGEYMPTKRQQYGAVPTGVAGWTNAVGESNDYGARSHSVRKNNRVSNVNDGYFGALSSAIGAVVSPVLDVLRPSRKENTVGNLRLYGDGGSKVPQSYIFNPNDRLPTTMRETTENSKYHMNINANQLGGAYRVTPQQPADTERMHQSDHYYAGNTNASNRQARAYDAEYRQRNNDVKAQTIDGRMVPGKMALLNNQIHMRAPDKSQVMQRDPVPNSSKNITPSLDAMGYMQQPRQELYATIQQDRNDGSVLAALHGNPYALKPFAQR
jgi:hypothetical protein